MIKVKTAEIILFTGSFLFGMGLIYLLYQNITLKERLDADRRFCELKVAQITNDYLEELAELQQYLPTQSSFDTTHAGVAMPRGESGDEVEKPTLERHDETLQQIVDRKYRFLFKHLTLSEAELDELRQLLMERERIAFLINDAREYEEVAANTNIQELELELAEIDKKIEQLLDSENRARYELLSDSDNEQHHYTQYTLGINGLFPLDAGQQEAVLFGRLENKRVFEQDLKDTGVYFDYPLTENERIKLYSEVRTAVERYKHRFLHDMQQQLDNSNYPFDQYTLLENYTNTEFKEMMEALEERINARGTSD